ncbi:DUF2865 domain-containing protein [Microvirga massiliensis]|uniref:DUF2865 domain-containing protein n=1 Tax=Microvirga massiliensis TaxID=1033741 RepID=UPI0006618326|nr:DUF2865 domain-containing protein [Microvirga massiliensis]
MSLALVAAAAALPFMVAPADAQDICDRYRAELASLERSGGNARPYASALQRQRQEIARLASYYQTIGCGRGTLFFPDPPECNAIASRVRQMQASAAYLQNQMPGGAEEVEARIRQLRGAIAATCGPEEARPARRTVGGSRLVCVRSCDGYFFPLGNVPKGDAGPEELCRALCPNADTVLFRAPVDGSIEEAVSEHGGRSYSDLRNALRYTRELDQSCTCRRPGQSWAEALRKAETMIDRKRSDILVTPEIADRMARAPVERIKGQQDASQMSRRPPVADPVETTGTIATKVDPGEAGPQASEGEGARLIPAAAAGRASDQPSDSDPKMTRRPRIIAPKMTRRPRIIAPEIIAVPANAR